MLDLEQFLRQSIRTAVTANSNYVVFDGGDAAFVEDVLTQVLTRVRSYVVQQVKYFLQQKKIVVAPLPLPDAPAPAPAGGSRLQSIFGLSGANNVKVDTPNYNYGYEFNSKT
jgi:hypothetical protein